MEHLTEFAHYPAPFDKFSRREKQILALILAGLRYKQIAADLQVSGKTVDTFRRTLMRKAGVDNVVALVLLAVTSGLITLPSVPINRNAPEYIEVFDNQWHENMQRPPA